MSDLAAPTDTDLDAPAPASAETVRTVAVVPTPTPWLSGVAMGAAALTALLAYLGNLGFAPAVAIGGGLCLPLLGRPRRPSRGMWLLMALLGWALVSYAWSPALARPVVIRRYHDVEALTGLKLVFELALFGAFALAMQRVSAAGARKAMLLLAIGLTGLAALLAIEAASGAALYSAIKAMAGQPTTPDLAVRNVARGCYALALLYWPAALFMLERNWRAPLVLVTGAALACPILLHVDAPLAALLASGAVYVLVRRTGAAGLWICLWAVVLYVILTPIVIGTLAGAGLAEQTPGDIGKLSWTLRLHIWTYVDRLILAHPVTGWGLDASRAWPEHIPLHPHNAALQVWLELGAVGAALFALFLAWLFSRIAVLEQVERGSAAAAAAALTAYLIIGALSFGVWQEWWLALGAVAIAVCGWLSAIRRDERERPAQGGALWAPGEPLPAQ